MKKKDIVVLGASGFAKEVMWLIEDINRHNNIYNILGFVDNDLCGKDLIINGHPVIGNDDWLIEYSKNHEVCGAFGIGDGHIRKKLVDKFKNVQWPNLVHPSVLMSEYNNIGIGNVFCAGNIVTTNITIGSFNLFNLNCTIGHDTVIEDYVSMMPAVNISGNVKIEEGTYFGTNACVIPPVKIAKWSIIGAGAVVIKDIIETATVVGNPAKPLNKK